ncbi:prestin-like [Condylostylus longicornis]|uniref:prestin-like n=1 Tax=Condylostylus longicornis TaxID=2530218 RepID=UPI00244DA89E|nr:prestin-like [Condylostylus longicornis]XP_055372388.1 prestin-like [Condylostylus longicornis]XP_055372389.1 prestin-like [Condylostylus longicornis]XP_055372390.1 prestin-like [Condylostylus longicornis]XP_055372392.1 prestin-like [Condylostylus longicornis]XP_055372393.1 prestin-like [Condylostylus longicornis]
MDNPVYENDQLDNIVPLQKDGKILKDFYEQDQLHKEFHFIQAKKLNVSEELKKKVKKFSCIKILSSIFPIITWLSQYSIKDDLMSDIISGFTVAIMHIPQGMGYALLANVPPIVGIYMAFFPVLLYIIFGTSRHNSMGTFAVVSIMVGKIVITYSTDLQHNNNNNFATLNSNNNNEHILLNVAVNKTMITSYDPISVAVTVCFAVGVLQLIMYILRLGIISSLLSEALVSGLTTGAAIHVLTSQIRDIFGLTFPKPSGYFQVIYTYIRIFEDFVNINWIATGMSTATILLLLFNNEFLKKYVSKRSNIPIPAELILVLAGTLMSKYLLPVDSVRVLNHIPTGFPDFKVPNFDLVQKVFLESIPVAMVSYAISISMALIFAQKFKYSVNGNQELLAMGISNIFGSFFSCLPISASLSRSVIQQTVGGKTQIASLVSCGLLIVILLWIGPFFEPLPRCVLSGIIVVSLKGLLLQLTQFFDFCKLNKLDAFVWAITFLTVVLIAIDIGLIIGIILSLGCILIGSMKPNACLLGHTNADLFLEIDRFKGATEIPRVKIVKYNGSINFANKSVLKSSIKTLLQLDITKQIQRLKKSENSSKMQINSNNFDLIIFDFSSLNFIDHSGVKFLKSLIDDLKLLGIDVYISGISCKVYDTIKKSNIIENNELPIFPTIQHAVKYSKNVMKYV